MWRLPSKSPPKTLAHHSSLAGHGNGASSRLPCGGASLDPRLVQHVAAPSLIGMSRGLAHGAAAPLRSLVAVRPLSVSCVELELELLVTHALQPCHAAWKACGIFSWLSRMNCDFGFQTLLSAGTFILNGLSLGNHQHKEVQYFLPIFQEWRQLQAKHHPLRPSEASLKPTRNLLLHIT